MQFLPGSCLIDTAVWMHNMDAIKTAGEEARQQLHKNAVSNIEQVLAATPHKIPTIRPPASHHENYQFRRTRHAGYCWRSKDELISDVLLWTSAYGQAKAEWPARTYIQQLCEDTGCSPEDLPEKSGERGSGISVLVARQDDDEDKISYFGLIENFSTNKIFLITWLSQIDFGLK